MKLCDFLSVELAAETATKECSRRTEVKSVERGGYHVVIFCLLLEYLPRYRHPEYPIVRMNPFEILTIIKNMTHGNSSALRLQAVEKAVGALKEGGLLCIVTPDSCHQVFLSFQKTF